MELFHDDTVLLKDLEQEDRQDRLSKLPDDILFLILEALQMREAARTSVLSRRWMCLLKQRSSIMMSIEDFYPKKDRDSMFTHDQLVKSTVKLIQATESMLQCQRLIRTLLVKFHLIEESIDIVPCIDKAMTKIPSLQFVLYGKNATKDRAQVLKINYDRLLMRFLAAGPRAFGGLCQLHIQFVKLGIDDMTNVLNACTNLEHLHLDHCYLFESVMVIEHPRLVTLTFANCACQTVELRCLPRLTCVTCDNWIVINYQYPISFGHVPQLSTLILRNATTIYHRRIRLSKFLSNHVMIRDLQLHFECLKVWIRPEAPKFLGPALPNLESLYLGGIREECNLDWTMFFLEAAPLLKKIHVQVWDHPLWEPLKDQSKIYETNSTNLSFSARLSWQAPEDLKHYSLKELTISGYQFKSMFTGYIRRVLKAAMKIERVTLLKNGLCNESDVCKYCMFPPRTVFPRTKRLRDMVKRQISKWASSPIEIRLGPVT